MDCSPPGSSVHGIFHTRVLWWVAIPFSRGSSWPRDQTWVSCIAGRFFTVWATREALYLSTPCLSHLSFIQSSGWETIPAPPARKLLSLVYSWFHVLPACVFFSLLVSSHSPHVLSLFCVSHWKGCDDYETLTLFLEGHRPQSRSKCRAPAAPRTVRSRTLTHKASNLHLILCVEAFQSPFLLTQTISHDKLQDVLTGDEESQPSPKCHSL